jgi:hypothetical protein
VIEAASGEEVLALLDELGIAPDRCVLDLPADTTRMDAVSLARVFRQRFPEAPVLIAREASDLALPEAGAPESPAMQFSLEKPFKDKDLRDFLASD